jgi:SAM-dependent methyltransferase
MLTIDRLRWLRTAGPDRIVMEQGIFPAVQEKSELRQILFVGIEWYTRKYPSLFGDREFWTLDIDPLVARYGAAGRHIVDSVTNVGDYFEPRSLDVIFCHGVFGPWLEEKEVCDRTFADCFEILRPGGLLILGWSTREDVMPHPPDTLQSIQTFEHFVLPPFTAWRHPTFGHWRMVIDFYRRPVDAG